MTQNKIQEVSMSFKYALKGIIKRFGFELHRLTPSSNLVYQRLMAMQYFNVRLVFDVGANTGQYASEMRSVGYNGRLVSFEPLTLAHAQLVKNASRDPLWEVHERCAIGDNKGEVEINVSGNSVSSSVLPMLSSHKYAAPTSGYIGSESTPIRTLDSVAPEYIHPGENYYIKIDTQGLESRILDGAQNVLRGAIGVQIELSLIPLYEGQQLWQEIVGRLEREGFTLWALQKGFTDQHNGRTLQMDAILFRLPRLSGGEE